MFIGNIWSINITKKTRIKTIVFLKDEKYINLRIILFAKTISFLYIYIFIYILILTHIITNVHLILFNNSEISNTIIQQLNKTIYQPMWLTEPMKLN